MKMIGLLVLLALLSACSSTPNQDPFADKAWDKSIEEINDYNN